MDPHFFRGIISPIDSTCWTSDEQLQLLPQAVSDIRQVLAQAGCTWQEFWKESWEKGNSENQQPNAEKLKPNAGSEEMGALYRASILGKTQSEQGFQETSRSGQEHLTNYSKEIVRWNSETLSGISREQQTAMPTAASYTPKQGVASP